MTELQTYPDVGSYLLQTEKFLLEREAVNNLPLGICYNLAEKKENSEYVFLSVVHKDKVMATCISRNGIVVLSAATYHASDLQLLLNYFIQNKITVRSLFGETLYVEIFSGLIKKKGNAKTYKLLSLEKLYKYKVVKAEFSPAANAEVDSLADYLGEYDREINALRQRDKDELRTVIENLIKDQRIYVVRLNNEIVCTAAYLRKTRNFGIIGNVFTPSAHRNRGYAAFCTGRLTEIILKEKKSVALFTDAKNSTANQLYGELGYKPTAEFSEVAFAE